MITYRERIIDCNLLDDFFPNHYKIFDLNAINFSKFYFSQEFSKTIIIQKIKQ